MKIPNIAWIVVCVIALAAFFRLRATAHDVSKETAAILAPNSPLRSQILDYKLIDARTGEKVTLASLKGKAKAIYLDVFASWCGPCRSLIPHVQELDKKLKERGVLVVGIDVSDQWDPMQRMIKEWKMEYQVLHDDGNGGGIHSYLGADTIPTVIVLDGKTLEQKARWVGGDNDAERDDVLRSLGVDIS